MNTFASRSHAFFAASAFLLTTAPALLAGDLVLQKVPALTVEQAPAYPANLARYHLGARIDASANGATASDLKAAETALLSGDPTASYALPTGQSTLLVALPQIENVSSISFANRGAQGRVKVATSSAKLPADSPQWHANAEQDLAVSGVQVKVGPGEAKYVRLTFDLTESGKIAGFGIYADPRVSDFTAPRGSKKASGDSASFGLISYNYTDMHAKARALYVSSGSDVSAANNVIDDQTSTTYRFAAGDSSPTAVIDLGKRADLRRLSAVYPAQAGKMEFYVLQSLPGQTSGASEVSASGVPIPAPDNQPSTLTVSDAALAAMKAVGTASDDGTQGQASVDFPTTSGRYVMVRWLPAAQAQADFSLAEVAALGGSRNTLLAANQTSGVAEEAAEGDYQTDGKTMIDGKTMLEPKDMPAEGPEEPPGEGPPPSLPQPPPFTFVPILVPTSP